MGVFNNDELVAQLRQWIKDLADRHEKEIANIRAEHAAHIADLKAAHAEERNHVIEENRELRELVERYRVALTPAVKQEKAPQAADTGEPPAMPGGYGGTPWQRVLAKAMADQEAEAKKRYTKPADAPVAAAEGTPDGIRQSGKPA